MIPLLEVRRLSKRFGGLVALDDVDFCVNPQDVLGIVGSNGAGKSTLFHLIAGNLTPSGGEIIYRDQAISAWSPERRVCAGIARTFQKTRLFYGLTIEENVRNGTFLQQAGGIKRLVFGTTKREQATLNDQIERILELTGLRSRRFELAGRLSYGYQRRLEVAIALGTQPKLLLLDEPFGGQSPESVQEMGHLIKTLSATGITVMLIEHRMESIVSYCKRLFVMEKGRFLIPTVSEEEHHAVRI